MENAAVAFQILHSGHQFLVIPFVYDKDSKYIFEKVKDILLLSFILHNCAKPMPKKADLANLKNRGLIHTDWIQNFILQSEQ